MEYPKCPLCGDRTELHITRKYIICSNPKCRLLLWEIESIAGNGVDTLLPLPRTIEDMITRKSVLA